MPVDDQLSVFAYNNIISLGLELGELEWLEYFIATFTQYLPTNTQENLQHFNIARLLFYKGDYKRARELLMQTEYEDILLNIGAKVMLLKIYYHEEELELLDALLDSFRIFLGRKKVLTYHKSHYMNLVKYTKKILQTIDVKSLKKEIENTSHLAEKKWLLEQL